MRILLVALALLSTPVFAQTTDVLRPGDVDLSDMQPYEYEYNIHVTAPMQQLFGTATESMTIEDGVSLTVMNINGQGVQQTDSIWVAWPMIAPVRRVTTVNGDQGYFDFTENAVSGMTREGSAIDVTLDTPIFGAGAADMIARAIMLDEGATAQFESFDDDNPDTPKMTTLTTTGQEEVLGRTAWIVTANDGDVTTYALDAETGETLRIGFSPQPGVLIELRRTDLETAE